ncbi:MAG: hypothetical protein QOD45_1921, partial [Pseudonocardiales bacterium]|nr:hypothetical protein [Pseudonocardiales bacterium]
GWTSSRTLGLLGVSLALFAAFLTVETRTAAPLIRLSLLRSRNLATANVVGVLWAAAMFAWFFLSALYLQLVLGYDALHVGLAFLPSNVIMAICSVAVSARLVVRFGNRIPLVSGLTLAAIGLLLLAQTPVNGHFAPDVLPSMLLLGVGAGIAFNPVLMAAMGDVSAEDSGLASGLVNTSFMMGGALGLAVLASLAARQTAGHVAADAAALLDGYHVAFMAGAVLAAAAAVVGYIGLRPSSDFGSDADWDNNREPEPACV